MVKNWHYGIYSIICALNLSFWIADSAKGEVKTSSATSTQSSFSVTKLSNGLEIVAIESHKVPLITIVLTVKAGAMTETPETRGLTHLWEHMFFKGNRRIPNQEAFQKRIRQLGITYNGDTSAEKVRYYFTLPSAFIDEGLQFMADAIATPLLEQSELERERRVVLDEYDRSAARPGFDYNNLQRVLRYGPLDHLRDPLGLRPIIGKATREQLFRIKNEVFVPSNSAIVISGDFRPDQLVPMVQKHFDGWKDPPNWKPIVPPKFTTLSEDISFTMTRPLVQNAHVEISFDGPKAREMPADTYAADILGHLLNLKTGKFYKKFVDSGLIFQGGLSYHTQSQAGEITVYATTNPNNAERVVAQLQSEINEWLKKDYFTVDQIDDVHRALLIDNQRQLNQPSEYAKSLAFWWAVTGLEYYGQYLNHMRNTNLEDINSFVQKWLIGKKKMISILLSPEDAKGAKIVDTSKPLVDKYLGAYKIQNSPK